MRPPLQEFRPTTREAVAEALGHPVGGRATDVQLIAAAMRGHLGRRQAGEMPGGSLSDGLEEAARLRASRRGFFALARHNLFGSPRPALPVRRTWRLPRAWQLDQGDTPQCVAYTKAHWHLSLPVALRKPLPAADYAAAKLLDGYPTEEGTDAGAMLKVAQQEGVVDSTWWWRGPSDTAALDEWLLTTGPVWFGAYWSESMFRTDPRGKISVTGDLKYGHETLLIGSDRQRKARIILNSWGRANWGIEGRGLLADADFDRMMEAGGDAVAIIERRAP